VSRQHATSAATTRYPVHGGCRIGRGCHREPGGRLWFLWRRPLGAAPSSLCSSVLSFQILLHMNESAARVVAVSPWRRSRNEKGDAEEPFCFAVSASRVVRAAQIEARCRMMVQGRIQAKSLADLEQKPQLTMHHYQGKTTT
jgi:hypothetical protein